MNHWVYVVGEAIVFVAGMAYRPSLRKEENAMWKRVLRKFGCSKYRIHRIEAALTGIAAGVVSFTSHHLVEIIANGSLSVAVITALVADVVHDIVD